MKIIKNPLFGNGTKNQVSSGLDYLQIDTEGFEGEIIKMTDFSIIKPKLIKFESVHLSKSLKHATISLLKAQGYRIIDERRDMITLIFQYFLMLVFLATYFNYSVNARILNH